VQIFDPRVAWLVSDILSDDNARLIGFGRNSTLKIERTAAVKTGTTTNFHDNWTVGYTPGLVVGVWVGNSDYQAMRDVNGLTGAAPIWQEVMRALLRGKPDEPFERPEGMLQKEVCTYSGLLPSQWCDKTHLEWFIAGTEPIQNDNVYRQIWLDPVTGQVAGDSTPPENCIQLIVLDLPPQTQRWAHSQGLSLLSDFSIADRNQIADLILASPQLGAVYQVSSALDIASQKIPIEALAGVGVTNVSLWIDGQQATAFTSAPYVFWWTFSEGKHTFQARGVDSSGQEVLSDSIEISVLKP
jgi:membrane carboxypeptidase/penicillin-binding protein PbpC